eukprot:365457-Chlamydomonas_euryale.AAC.11
MFRRESLPRGGGGGSSDGDEDDLQAQVGKEWGSGDARRGRACGGLRVRCAASRAWRLATAADFAGLMLRGGGAVRRGQLVGSLCDLVDRHRTHVGMHAWSMGMHGACACMHGACTGMQRAWCMHN